MFPPEQIFDELIRCWDSSSRALFQKFMAANAGVTKWMIAADYCLRDTTRANDCFAFTIVPHRIGFDDLKLNIKAALPVDIKKARYLSADGANLLSDPNIFHIVIIVPKDREVFNNGPGSDPLKISREVAELTLAQARERERGDNTIKPLKKMVQAAKANNFNHELYGDLLLLGFFYPFVSLLLNRERPAEDIAWMSDRDNMTTWGNGIVWNNATESFKGLGHGKSVEVDATKVQVCVPNPDTGAMWFDELIRLPDFMAGAVAAWDAPQNQLPDQPKSLVFVQLLEHVFADAENTVVLNLDIGENGLQWKRMGIHLQPGHTKVELGPRAKEPDDPAS